MVAASTYTCSPANPTTPNTVTCSRDLIPLKRWSGSRSSMRTDACRL
jgi:hypothetical protein